MKYSCSKLVSCHLPLQLFREIERIGDEELLSRSQVLRDCVLFYLANREASTGDIRSTRKKMLAGDVWGKLFGQQ
jgi:metal-responsive CopG/Arc/MetJ family transcriptional regulator